MPDLLVIERIHSPAMPHPSGPPPPTHTKELPVVQGGMEPFAVLVQFLARGTIWNEDSHIYARFQQPSFGTHWCAKVLVQIARQLASRAAHPTHLCWVNIVPQLHGIHVDAGGSGADLVRVHYALGLRYCTWVEGKTLHRGRAQNEKRAIAQVWMPDSRLSTEMLGGRKWDSGLQYQERSATAVPN